MMNSKKQDINSNIVKDEVVSNIYGSKYEGFGQDDMDFRPHFQVLTYRHSSYNAVFWGKENLPCYRKNRVKGGLI